MSDRSSTDREAPVGPVTLIVFILMVLIAAVSAGVLISVVQLEPSSTTHAGGPAEAGPVEVPVVTGTVSDGTVATVTLTVTPAPGTDPVNLLNTTLTWIGPNGTVYLTHTDVSGGDGDFVAAAVKDTDGSMPLLNDPDDRAILTIDAESMGQALGPGATASIKVTPASGATTTVQVTVPQSLDDRTSVAL